MIEQWLMSEVFMGLLGWHWTVIGILIVAFIPVSAGIIKRSKKMLHRTSESIFLVGLAACLYFLFRYDMWEVLDRVMGVALFAVVSFILFVIWEYKRK